MIADPLLPKKVLEGREQDIRWCVACTSAWRDWFRDAPMTCYINPLCAHEHDPRYTNPPPADPKKNIMIVGGGPAGLECAYMAAQRGHEVHVYRKSGKELGGTILEASKGLPTATMNS